MYVPSYVYGLKNNVLHRKQCCYKKKAIRIIDQHLQSWCHQSLDSQHWFAVAIHSTCVAYIIAYMTKSEWSMGELLKQVSKECGNEGIRTQLRHFRLVFLDHREVIAQEAVYRVPTLMPLKQLSRKVVFVNTLSCQGRQGISIKTFWPDSIHGWWLGGYLSDQLVR